MYLDSLAIFRISNGINLKGHLLAIKEKSWAQKSKSISAAVIQNPTKPKRPKNGELYFFFSQIVLQVQINFGLTKTKHGL
jgi:hypothetical protein